MLKIFGDIETRPFRREDAAAVSSLYNRYAFGPAAHGYPLTPEDLLRGLEEKGVVKFLVAEYKQQEIVATMSFHPVSGQKATRSGAVWAGHFFIHPEFRHGTVPLYLYTKGLEFCIQSGYERLDAEVSPVNFNALSLFKRGGFNRTTGSLIDRDDYMELFNYIPYMAAYLRNVMNEEQVTATDLLTTWKYLLPMSTARTLKRDSVDWHGGEIVRYDMKMPGRFRFSCLIDVRVETVTAFYSDLLDFECYPLNESREVQSGERAAFRFSFANRSSHALRVALSSQAGSEAVPDLLPPRTFRPGEEWTAEREFQFDGEAGLRRVESELRVEVPEGDQTRELRFPAATWVQVVAPQQDEPATAVSHRVAAPAGPAVRAEATDQGWVLENAWLSVRVDGRTGAVDLTDRVTGRHGIREIWPDVGPPYPGGYKRPAERPVTLVDLKVSEGWAEIVLESLANIWWARHQADLVRMYPHRAGLESLRLRRRLVLGTDQLLRVETTLHRDEQANTPAVVGEAAPLYLRTFPWAWGSRLNLAAPLREGLVQSPVVYEGFPFGLHDHEYLRSGDLPSDPAAYAAPWSAFSQEGEVAGLLWPGAAEVRFGLQWMPSVLYDVPPLRRGESYRFPSYYLWFGPGDHQTIAHLCRGIVGPEGVEKEPAGGQGEGAPTHWPLLLAADPPVAVQGEAICLQGTLRSLSGRTRQGQVRVDLPGALPAAEGAAADLRSDVGSRSMELTGDAPAPLRFNLGPVNRPPGTYTAEVTWQEGAEPARETVRWPVPLIVLGEPAGEVTVRQQGEMRLIDNGRLHFAVAPSFDGTLIRLKGRGRQWLRTFFPKRHPLGHSPQSTGGAKFYPVPDSRDWRVTLSQEMVPWRFQGRTAALADAAGRRWSGVVMEGAPGAGPWQDLSASVAWLTLPGSHLVLVRAGFANGGQEPLVFDSIFGLHAAPEESYSFRVWRDGREFSMPPSPARAVGTGRQAGALVARDGMLVLAAGADSEVRAWRDEGAWEMKALTPLHLGPGESRMVTLWLALADPEERLAAYAALAGCGFPALKEV